MPEDDVRDAYVKNSAQQKLFPMRPRELCQRIGLNWLAAIGLRDRGWLSFDPELVSELDDEQTAELEFVGSLVAAGCDEAMLSHLLRDLSKPYRYDPNLVYYHWPSQKWKLIPQYDEPDPWDVFRKLVDSLVEDGDRERLEDIAEEIENTLDRVNDKEDDTKSE